MQDDYFRQLSVGMNAAIVVSRPMKAVQAHLDEIVATIRLRPPCAMPMVVVTAPFSAGKSTLLKQWGFGVHRSVLGDEVHSERPTWSPKPGVMADWVPVVYVTLMASSSIKEINALILLYLGYPPEGLARTTTTRVLDALRMHGVQIVVLDDAHMLRSTNAQGRAILDYIKFLNTELGEVNNGTVILVGDLTVAAPAGLSTSILAMRFPNFPAVPELLRDQRVLHVRVANTDPSTALDQLLAPLREQNPVMDTINVMATTELATIHAEPAGPVTFEARNTLLGPLDRAAIDVLLDHVGPDGTDDYLLEMRHLGGALGPNPSSSAVVGHRDATFVLYTGSGLDHLTLEQAAAS